jgi:regulator of replication initiation timing
MQKLLVPLLCLALLACGVALYSKTTANRALESKLAAVRTALDAEIAKQEQTLAQTRRVREENEAFKQESEHLRNKLATLTNEPATAEVAKPDERGSGAASWMKSMAKMFSDPEMKKTVRTQQLMGIRMMYADAIRELGLSREDGDIVLDILADRQMDLSAAAMKQFGGDSAAADGASATADIAKSHIDKLKSVLGEEKFKNLESYEASMGDRILLNQFEGEFTSAGAPLAKDQKDQLLAIMRDERSKTPPDQPNLGNTGNATEQIKALQTDEGIDRLAASQENFNRRVMDRAQTLLSPDQIAAFEKVQKQQMELLHMQLKMSREMFRSK